jgi:hypothetical protein
VSAPHTWQRAAECAIERGTSPAGLGVEHAHVRIAVLQAAAAAAAAAKHVSHSRTLIASNEEGKDYSSIEQSSCHHNMRVPNKGTTTSKTTVSSAELAMKLCQSQDLSYCAMVQQQPA